MKFRLLPRTTLCYKPFLNLASLIQTVTCVNRHQQHIEQSDQLAGMTIMNCSNFFSTPRHNQSVFESRVVETLQPNPARITPAAAPAFPVRVITAVRQRIIHAQFHSRKYRLALRHIYDWRVNPECPLLLCPRRRSKISHCLERPYVIMPTVRIPAEVRRLTPTKYRGVEHFAHARA
jgi:hypothetical protein